jgi:hypothetical protein
VSCPGPSGRARRGPAQPALTESAGSICRHLRAARRGARAPLVLRGAG